MITINEIVDMFSEVEPLVKPCPLCGKKPMFVYRDSCTHISIIRLGHICAPRTTGATIDKAVDLMQLSQYYNQKFFINCLLEEMVNEWNRSIG